MKLFNVYQRSVGLNCSLDASRMHQLVSFLQQYLSDHFHAGPYKHGENDSVIMAVKSLELLCKYKFDLKFKHVF